MVEAIGALGRALRVGLPAVIALLASAARAEPTAPAEGVRDRMLLVGLEDPDPEARVAAVNGLAEHGKEAIPRLAVILHTDESPEVRKAAAARLGAFDHLGAAQPLRRCVAKESEAVVKDACRKGLSKLGVPEKDEEFAAEAEPPARKIAIGLAGNPFQLLDNAVGLSLERPVEGAWTIDVGIAGFHSSSAALKQTGALVSLGPTWYLLGTPFEGIFLRPAAAAGLLLTEVAAPVGLKSEQVSGFTYGLSMLAGWAWALDHVSVSIAIGVGASGMKVFASEGAKDVAFGNIERLSLLGGSFIF